MAAALLSSGVTAPEKQALLEPGANALYDAFRTLPAISDARRAEAEYAQATRTLTHTYRSAQLETEITVEFERDYGDRLPGPRVRPIGITVTAIKHQGWDVGQYLEKAAGDAVEREFERLWMAAQ